MNSPTYSQIKALSPDEKLQIQGVIDRAALRCASRRRQEIMKSRREIEHKEFNKGVPR